MSLNSRCSRSHCLHTEGSSIFDLLTQKQLPSPLALLSSSCLECIWGGERCCSLACLGIEWRKEHCEFTVGCSVGGGMNVLPSGITGLMPTPHICVCSGVNLPVQALTTSQHRVASALCNVVTHSTSLHVELKMYIYVYVPICVHKSHR